MTKPLVQMKGTKDGFVIMLDDTAAYAAITSELMHVTSSYKAERQVDVQLHLGYRYCTAEQQQELADIAAEHGNMVVTNFQSDVVSMAENKRLLNENKNEMYFGVVRSGQVVQATGDIIVVGNVNPNGRVEAGGNIYVLGKLRGIAHAGVNGNRDAVVAASFLEATHIMIDDYIEAMSNEQEALQQSSELKCACLDEGGHITYRPIYELRNMPSIFMAAKGGS